MDGQIEISAESIQEALTKVQDYFNSLDMYQTIAWGAMGLGLVLCIVGLFLL